MSDDNGALIRAQQLTDKRRRELVERMCVAMSVQLADWAYNAKQKLGADYSDDVVADAVVKSATTLADAIIRKFP